jgi:CheY-like chemotaxis protein
LLGDEGALVTLAGDGQQALDAMAQRGPFDIVLMDLQMPVMDGLEATRRIRQQWGLEVPIVAMTANAMASDRDICLAAGMNDHVGKPFDLPQLIETIQRYTRSTSPQAPASAVPAPLSQALVAQAEAGGIDVSRALQRMGGHPAAYWRLAESLLEGLPRVMADIESNHRAAHLPATRMGLHTLKGLAATLGATELAAMAAQAEREWGEPAHDAGLLTGLIQETERVRQQLMGLLAARGQMAKSQQAEAPAVPHGQEDAPDCALLLRKLRQLAQDCDMGAAELLPTLQAHCSKAMGPRCEAMATALRTLAFEDVVRIVDDCLMEKDS